MVTSCRGGHLALVVCVVRLGVGWGRGQGLKTVKAPPVKKKIIIF